MCLDAKTNSIHLFKQPQNISVIFCQKCVGFLFFFKGEKNRCSVWRKGPALFLSLWLCWQSISQCSVPIAMQRHHMPRWLLMTDFLENCILHEDALQSRDPEVAQNLMKAGLYSPCRKNPDRECRCE